MQRQLLVFILRWIFNSFGLWIAARLLNGHGVTYDPAEVFITFLTAGFMLSIVNAVLKPILLILSLPAILLTLGLFMVIVNGFSVWLASLFVPGLDMTFWAAVLSGIIIGLINFVLTGLLESQEYSQK